MKTILHTSCLAILLGMGISGNGNAATISTIGSYFLTDVGSTDLLKGYTNALDNSNPATEQDWLNTTLGTQNITFDVKNEEISVYSTFTLNVFAVQLQDTPDYYILKNATYWALFENVEDLNWGVFNISLLPDGMNVGDGHLTISHVSEFQGSGDFCTTHPGDPSCGDVPMPEPGMLALIGLGMLSMFVPFRRSITI